MSFDVGSLHVCSVPKLLIGIPSPRDIPEFMEATARLPHNKFWAKYMREMPAYDLIRTTFLEHEEHSHLALLADDLIVGPDMADRLWSQMLAHDFQVLTGYSNIGREPELEIYYNISLEHVPSPIMPSKMELDTKTKIDGLVQQGQLLHRVRTMGFTFAIFRRDVIEALPFADDTKYNVRYDKEGKIDNRGGNVDRVWCYEADQLGIETWVDLGAKGYHIPNSRRLNFMVGFLSPYGYMEEWCTEKSD